MPKKDAWPEEKIAPPGTDEIAVKATMVRKEEIRIARVDRELGDGKPFDLERLGCALRVSLATTVEQMVQTSRIISWAHERVSKADWLAWLQKWGGLSEWTGYRYLSIAQKFHADDLHVMKKLPANAIYEYFSCSEDDLEEFRKELQADGTILGHKIDKEDRKSIRDLCNDLRKTRERNRVLERQADELRVRVRAKERETAELAERMKQPTARLASMLDVAKEEALELIRTEPRASQSRMKFLVSQQFYFAFKEVWCSPLGGEPLVEGPEIEGHDRNFYRVIDGKLKTEKS